MKKLFVFMLMLVALAGAAFAGSLQDYEYNNNADERSDYNVTVDADTLEGNTASDFVSLAYVQSRESDWSRLDGRGLNSRGVSNLLFGRSDMFERYDTFLDYLKVWFAPRSEVEALRQRVDELEARLLGQDLDSYQKAKAVESGSYGPYTCAEGLCIKQVE